MMTESLNRLSAEQQGTTLIEVLITLVIISVGLLSVAALQAVALKSNNGSYLRSQATFLAYDLADRIRAAPASALNGDYDDASAGGDRQEWNNRVITLLGNGASGQVARTDREVLITISWNDDRARITGVNGGSQAGPVRFNYRMEF